MISFTVCLSFVVFEVSAVLAAIGPTEMSESVPFAHVPLPSIERAIPTGVGALAVLQVSCKGAFVYVWCDPLPLVVAVQPMSLHSILYPLPRVDIAVRVAHRSFAMLSPHPTSSSP